MIPYTNHIPFEVKAKLSTLGQAGEIWVSNLDHQIHAIKDLWALKLGKVLSGGSDSLVIEAITEEGQLAVLKLSIPDNFGLRKEGQMLHIMAGNSYPKLYKQDAKAAIFLIERLGTSLAATALPLEEKISHFLSSIKKVLDKNGKHASTNDRV